VNILLPCDRGNIFVTSMKAKKITSFFFILVLCLQLLPIRQAMQYFFNDNPLVEELVTAGKSTTKNVRLFDEDHHSLNDFHQLAFQINLTDTKKIFRFDESLPSLYTADILTPPPNKV
jgi:hypothetical protein